MSSGSAQFVEVNIVAHGFKDWSSITHVRTTNGETISATVYTVDGNFWYAIVRQEGFVQINNPKQFALCGFTPLKLARLYTFDEALGNRGMYQSVTGGDNSLFRFTMETDGEGNPKLLNEEGKMHKDVLEHLPLYIANYLRSVLREVVVTDPDFEDVARGSLEEFSVQVRRNDWLRDVTEK